MNQIDHVVTKVLSEPYFTHLWCVDVEAEAYGTVMPTTVYFNSKEEAENVIVGYEFIA